MEQKSMTALISAFSRAYHAENNDVKIFNDSVARLLLTDEEFSQISKSMADGIHFFNPSFSGTPEEALRWVVDNQLSPSPLGRAAFAEQSLETAVSIGATQYLILGAGYDTFAYRQPDWAAKLQIFELDHPVTARDKKIRLDAAELAIKNNVYHIAADFTKEQWWSALTQNSSFSREKISFCSILGVAYYLSRESFEKLISAISSLVPKGSSIVFDYPDENSYTAKAGSRAKKQAMLAGAANEKMLASYSYEDMEKLMAAYGFLIYEHLTPLDITAQYFETYNRANPSHFMTAFDNVDYCLAIKR
ncbi:class I SAM-dependent methyltransferase [Oscillospiraceae bacterium PP1C4]